MTLKGAILVDFTLESIYTLLWKYKCVHILVVKFKGCAFTKFYLFLQEVSEELQEAEI